MLDHRYSGRHSPVASAQRCSHALALSDPSQLLARGEDKTKATFNYCGDAREPETMNRGAVAGAATLVVAAIGGIVWRRSRRKPIRTCHSAFGITTGVDRRGPMDVAEVFSGIGLRELIVFVLSYATECEAIRLCHEWRVPDEVKALAWSTSVRSLEEIRTSSMLSTTFCADIACAGDLEL